MARSRWLLVAALVLAVLGTWALVASALLGTQGEPTLTDVRPAPPAPTLRPTPTPTPAPTPTPTPSPTPSPASTPRPTPTGVSDGDAARRFAEFERRLIGARTEVLDLNAALTAAVENQDDAAAIATAVAMLAFVDAERDWLAANPPAVCFADAHAAAGAMLPAYGAVADAAIAYANAVGFVRLESLALLFEAAEVAGGALDSLVAALESTTCPG